MERDTAARPLWMPDELHQRMLQRVRAWRERQKSPEQVTCSTIGAPNLSRALPLCLAGEGQEAEARLRKEQDAAYEAAMAQVRHTVWLHVEGGGESDACDNSDMNPPPAPYSLLRDRMNLCSHSKSWRSKPRPCWNSRRWRSSCVSSRRWKREGKQSPHPTVSTAVPPLPPHGHVWCVYARPCVQCSRAQSTGKCW